MTGACSQAQACSMPAPGMQQLAQNGTHEAQQTEVQQWQVPALPGVTREVFEEQLVREKQPVVLTGLDLGLAVHR